MPNLGLPEGQIPPASLGGEFIYLGRRFSFDLKHDSAKQALEEKLNELMKITSNLKIRVQTQLKILSLYIHSQILFDIKLYDFPATWVEQKLDALCIRYMRDWLEMPISACVGEVASIPRKMCGLGIESVKHLAQKMCLNKRYAIRASSSADVREIWADTATQQVPIDELIVSHSSVTAAVKALKLDQIHKDANHLFGLQLQGALAKSVTESIATKNIT